MPTTETASSHEESRRTAAGTGARSGRARRRSTARPRRSASPDRASRVFRRSSGAARWIAFAEMMLSAVEDAVWELRETYDEIVGEAVRGWGELRGNATELNGKRRNLEAELLRLLDISRTVTAVILSYRFTSIGGAFMRRESYERRLESLHRKNARRIVEMAERLQGGMIKVGQMLSARTDLLPAAITEELSKLQDRVTPLSRETVTEVLERAWGAERLASVTLDVEPVGAASIAQVHRAVLPGGQEVAVKIRRPGIETILRHDMANLRRVLGSLAAYLPDFEIDSVIDEIETQVLKEVEFDTEIESIGRAVKLMEGIPGIVVPAVVSEWCAEDVLVTEFQKGSRIDLAMAELAGRGDRQRIDDVLSRLFGIYARQILEWGFFQPDTHPGNFLVKDDGTLVLLDYGCAREIPDEFRRNLARAMQAFLTGNDSDAAKVIQDLGFRNASGDLTPVVTMGRKLLVSLVSSGGDVWNTEKMAAELEDAARMLLEDPVTKVPAEAIMVGRALMTIGGLFYTHKPKIDPVKTLLPVIAKAMAGK